MNVTMQEMESVLNERMSIIISAEPDLAGKWNFDKRSCSNGRKPFIFSLQAFKYFSKTCLKHGTCIYSFYVNSSSINVLFVHLSLEEGYQSFTMIKWNV